jgi:Ca-activated chloride channel family protein
VRRCSLGRVELAASEGQPRNRGLSDLQTGSRVYNRDVPRLLLALLCLVPAVAAAGSVPRMPGMYSGQGTTALPMLDSSIDITVRGPIIETTITQTFRNASNEVTEATYIFPLPADAAVSAMAIDLGARKIHAAIEPRGRAQARYEAAVAAGIGAGLLEQERPDVFTQTVSAIPARGTVTVTLRYDAIAHYADGTWEMVVPLVVAPRFVPGTVSGRPTTGSGHNPDTDRAPDASRVTPHSTPGGGGPTELAIAFQTEVEQVTSPSHELAHTTPRYMVADPNSDHDLIVRWHAKLPTQGWVEAEPNGTGFAAALITGPAAAPHGAAAVRFIVDRAATTRGDGDAVERALVRALLGALTANDHAGPAAGELRAPRDFQKTIEDEWAAPSRSFDLSRVLATAKPSGAPIVLVTDGLIADDAAVISAARQLGVPIYVIGIGAAPNRSLLAAIATATRGTVRFAIAGDDLVALAADVISDAANPAAAVTLSWGTLAASSVVPAQLPRIGAGQATLVIAAVTHAQASNARAGGDVFALTSFTAPKSPIGATASVGALARRWSRMRLDELVAVARLDARHDPSQITEHAMRWGLVSPYTAMVAVGDEVVVEGGVKHTKSVPVSLPAGMRWQPVKQEVAFNGLDHDGQIASDDAKRADQPATQKAPQEKPATQKAPKEKAPKEDAGEVTPITPRHEYAPTRPATRPTANTPTAQPDRGSAAARDVSRTADDAEDQAEPRAPASPEPTVALSGEAAGEALAIDAISYEGGPHLRFALALGAGLSYRAHASAFVSMLRAGVVRGGRTLHLGGEAALWLDGAGEVEATLLGTLSRPLAPRLEVSLGLGLHLGPGAGPAAALMLRYALPRPLWLYLRYDGALLFHDQTRDGQHTGTVGIEAHF